MNDAAITQTRLTQAIEGLDGWARKGQDTYSCLTILESLVGPDMTAETVNHVSSYHAIAVRELTLLLEKTRYVEKNNEQHVKDIEAAARNAIETIGQQYDQRTISQLSRQKCQNLALSFEKRDLNHQLIEKGTSA